ncbi:type VI secretion system-associated protein TagO [Falsirhodobacter sp. 1013]|uniref:type VI secretion system-associated protein TagO n=1 Tax=Falsirhodobacter sp. 1013 TaxID=3417566 RepID=UPI003EC0D4BB
MTNASERLRCYDGIFRGQENEAASETSTPWTVSSVRSLLDDSTTTVMQTSSLDPLTLRNGQTEHGALIIRCKEGVTSAYITFAGHFMSDLDRSGRVNYRIDDLPATWREMTISGSHEALGMWDMRQASMFISAIMGGSELFVRATPLNESPIEMQFNIAGAAEAAKPLRENCRW